MYWKVDNLSILRIAFQVGGISSKDFRETEDRQCKYNRHMPKISPGKEKWDAHSEAPTYHLNGREPYLSLERAFALHCEKADDVSHDQSSNESNLH